MRKRAATLGRAILLPFEGLEWEAGAVLAGGSGRRERRRAGAVGFEPGSKAVAAAVACSILHPSWPDLQSTLCVRAAKNSFECIGRNRTPAASQATVGPALAATQAAHEADEPRFEGEAAIDCRSNARSALADLETVSRTRLHHLDVTGMKSFA